MSFECFRRFPIGFVDYGKREGRKALGIRYPLSYVDILLCLNETGNRVIIFFY